MTAQKGSHITSKQALEIRKNPGNELVMHSWPDVISQFPYKMALITKTKEITLN